MNEKKLDIKSVARLSGVSIYTLRAWENRYAIVSPERTETGRRRYSYGDLNKIKLVNQLVNRGHRIGSVAKLTSEELQNLSEADTLNEQQDDNLPNSELFHLLKLIENYDLTALHQNLARIRHRVNSESFVLSFALPLIQEVGIKVSRDQLSMVQEHAMSAIIREQLNQIVSSVPIPVAPTEQRS